MRNPSQDALGHSVTITLSWFELTSQHFEKISSDAGRGRYDHQCYFKLVIKIPLYFTIPVNQSVQWSIIRDLNIAHLLFTQARWFFVVIWLDCSLLPNGGSSDFSWIFFRDFLPCSCRMTEPYIFFIGDWRSQQNPLS